MPISFKEKGLWLILASLVACFAFYFYLAASTASPLTGERNVSPAHVAWFAVAVATLVVLQIVGFAVIGIVDRRTETDERDQLIGLKSTRNGAYILATGVFCALTAALLTKGNLIFVHVLLGFWVLAQLVEIATQLYLYRRGV